MANMVPHNTDNQASASHARATEATTSCDLSHCDYWGNRNTAELPDDPAASAPDQDSKDATISRRCRATNR
jgi:hypothetical protein